MTLDQIRAKDPHAASQWDLLQRTEDDWYFSAKDDMLEAHRMIGGGTAFQYDASRIHIKWKQIT